MKAKRLSATLYEVRNSKGRWWSAARTARGNWTILNESLREVSVSGQLGQAILKAVFEEAGGRI